MQDAAALDRGVLPTVPQPVKVNVEKQPDATSTLYIELPPEEVSKEWNEITDSFARFARIPGYRPGKAPRKVIEAKFKKQIQDELTQKLVSKSYRAAIEQKNLRVVSLTNLEDVQIADDKSMRYRATVITAPEFDLPEYRSISVELPPDEINDADVDAALERLREQSADFVDTPERPVQMEDFVVIDFEGRTDEKPIAEVAANASKTLQGGKKFWLRLAPDNFLPKFCEQLVGMNKGETRNVTIDLQPDFPVTELAGRQLNYTVTLQEIKEKKLPVINEEFAAKLMPGKSLEDLRHALRHDLEHEKEHEIDRAKEGQIVKHLHDNTKFELPPPLLRDETRRALTELVQRNRERGVTDEALKGKEKALVEGAAGVAAHRLRTRFILSRIAEQEKIEVTKKDIDHAVRHEAARYNISPEKMRKELEEHDGLNALAEQILLGKVLDFLKSNVSVKSQSETAVSEEKS